MKRAFILLCGAFVIAVVAVLLVAGRKQARNVIVVGGMQVEFLDVLPAGKQFTTEKPWHALAKKILPSRFQNWIPSSTSGTCSSGSNSITIYVQVTAPNGRTVAQLPWQNYRAESLDGEPFPEQGGYCSFGGGMVGSPTIYGLTLRAFPRRDSKFVLRFGKDDGTALGSITVPNPLRPPFPEWKPLPVPQTVTNGDVAVTLKSLSQHGQPGRTYCRADYAVVSTNPLWSGASVTYTSFSDATGNEGSILSRKEPAWRVTATVHRKEAARMLDSEKLILTDIVPTAPGTVILADANAVLAGVGFRLLAMAGPGMVYRTNSGDWAAFPLSATENYPNGTSGSSSYNNTQVRHWGFSKPFFLVETDSRAMTNGAQLFCRAFGSDGRELGAEHANGYETDSNGWQTRAISFENWTNGTISRLEILISRPRVFEFTISPSVVKTNEASR